MVGVDAKVLWQTSKRLISSSETPRPSQTQKLFGSFVVPSWPVEARCPDLLWRLDRHKPWHSHCCQHTCLMKNNSSQPLQLWGLGVFVFCRLGGWCCCRGVWSDYPVRYLVWHALRAQGREGLWGCCGSAGAAAISSCPGAWPRTCSAWRGRIAFQERCFILAPLCVFCQTI